MNNLAFKSIKDLREKLVKKEISSKELLGLFISRFKKFDKQLNSAIEIFPTDSIKFENETGALSGIPGLIKDNICQQDRITSASSKILSNYSASYDATVTKRIKNSGAVSIGRANCDEFAMGSSNETSYYGKVYNPWDISRAPGGSSGGSAAAVAAGLVPWSFGSETGGSIRLPAMFCGIVGSKPTYGLVSRYGLLAYGSSLDQVGVFTRTVYDNALVLSQIAGQDKQDSTTLSVSAQDYTKNLTGKIKPGMTIAVIDNALNAEGMEPEIAQILESALKDLEKLGAKIKRIKLPTMEYGAAVYFMISRAEAASNLSRFDGVKYGYRSKNAETLSDMYSNTREEGFGDVVKLRILIGNYVLSVGHADAFYESARTVQAMMRQEFLEAFKECDLLFAPVAPIPAFKFGAFKNNLALDLMDYFTCPANLIGIPALSVPCGFTKENLPVGFQLMGPHLSEDLIFQTAHAYELVNEWYKKVPQDFV